MALGKVRKAFFSEEKVTAQVGRRISAKRRQAEESGSFLKKRTKKLFTLWAGVPARAEARRPNVSCCLFSNKPALLPLAFASRRLAGQLQEKNQKTFDSMLSA
jgi:hypothetical protein